MLKVWKSLLILVVSRHLTGTCRPEIMRRIGHASAVMSSIRSVWNNRQLCVDTKVHVYHALVQSVLLYGDAASFGHQETWSDLRCQRQLLHVSWRDHITNEAICKQTKLTSLTELISRRRTSLFGHRSTWRSCPSMHIKPVSPNKHFHRKESGYKLEEIARSSQENMDLSDSRWYWNVIARLLGCLHSSWPWKRDATVFEDCALMMMTHIHIVTKWSQYPRRRTTWSTWIMTRHRNQRL